MALVQEITQVSCAEFFNTASVHCIVCSPAQVKSPSITTLSRYTLLHLPSPHPRPAAITTLLSIVVCVYEFFLFYFSFLLNPSLLPPSSRCATVHVYSLLLSVARSVPFYGCTLCPCRRTFGLFLGFSITNEVSVETVSFVSLG